MAEVVVAIVKCRGRVAVVAMKLDTNAAGFSMLLSPANDTSDGVAVALCHCSGCLTAPVRNVLIAGGVMWLKTE